MCWQKENKRIKHDSNRIDYVAIDVESFVVSRSWWPWYGGERVKWVMDTKIKRAKTEEYEDKWNEAKCDRLHVKAFQSTIRVEPSERSGVVTCLCKSKTGSEQSASWVSQVQSTEIRCGESVFDQKRGSLSAILVSRSEADVVRCGRHWQTGTHTEHEVYVHSRLQPLFDTCDRTSAMINDLPPHKLCSTGTCSSNDEITKRTNRQIFRSLASTHCSLHFIALHCRLWPADGSEKGHFYLPILTCTFSFPSFYREPNGRDAVKTSCFAILTEIRSKARITPTLLVDRLDFIIKLEL